MDATTKELEETSRLIGLLEKKAAERNDKVVMSMLDAATNTDLVEERLVLMSLASLRLDGLNKFTSIIVLRQLREIGLMLGIAF